MANKVDLGERRVVGVAEGRSFAQSKDLQYFECSAVSHESYLLMSLHAIFVEWFWCICACHIWKKPTLSLSRIFPQRNTIHRYLIQRCKFY